MGKERVTCKVAIYNIDHTKVLLAQYTPDKFGLPGGHIELEETPRQGVMREIYEELGLRTLHNLKKRDFWRHPNGKIVLGFTAELDESTELNIDPTELLDAVWIPISDIAQGITTAGTYDKFIITFAHH